MSTTHPSDEDLSAHLDGEAPDVTAHVAACAGCRTRLDDLRRAAALVAAPLAPPDPGTRDQAIARAIDAGVASVRPRRLAVLAAAAAIVVVAGVATPVLLRRSPHRTTAALSTSRDASGRVSAGAAAAGSQAAAVPLDGGDLGDQSDASALGGLVSSALPSGAGTTADKGAGLATSSGGAPAPEAAARSAQPCTPPADGGAVVYRARLRWKGVAAQVFGIEPGRRLVVMDSARCQVLVDRHF